jgi:hypothetical protein
MDEPFSAQNRAMSKRQGVIQAVESMSSELQADDKVSIAFFDSRAYIIAEQLTGKEQKKIIETVNKLSNYSGSTNFEAAFQIANKWSEESTRNNQNRRVVFLTDGNHTTGNWNNALNLNAKISNSGAVIDCLGVGTDFAFDLMQNLSLSSGGTTHLLDTPASAKQQFREILFNTQRALVHDVLLRLRIPPDRRNIEIYQIVPEIRYHAPKPDANGVTIDTIRMGHIYHHQISSLLVYIVLDTHTTASPIELFQCRLDYSIPLLGLRSCSHDEIVRLNLSDRPGSEQNDSSISLEYTEASLSRDEQDFRQCYRTNWQKAAQILQQMINKARQINLNDKVKTYEDARAKLISDHKLSQEQLNAMFARTSRSTMANRQPQRSNPGDLIF